METRRIQTFDVVSNWDLLFRLKSDLKKFTQVRVFFGKEAKNI